MTSAATPTDPSHAILLESLGKHFKARSERRRFSIFGGLAPRRRTLRALDGLDLTVPRGEMLGVIGMNGSGKSTLLKIISGITQPTVGTMDVQGRVGSLIELGAGFHPDLSGYENIYLNGSLLGMEHAEIDALIGEIVEYAGLEGYMDLPVKHFSMGMTLRLGFAIATQIQPDILLLDETMSVGDIEFQARALQTIQTFRDKGTTILLVSHDIFTVREQCDRVLWLHEGQAKQIGPATEVVDAYRDYLAERGGGNAHEMLAMHGDGLYSHRTDGEPPVEIVRVETLDDAGVPTDRLDHPARVTLAVHWRARHATDDACFRIAMIRRENQAVALERNSITDGQDPLSLEGEGTVRFSFEAERFYSDAFRFIAAVGPTDEKEGVWDRATVDFDIDNIPQLMPGWFSYLTDPCREIEYRPDAS